MLVQPRKECAEVLNQDWWRDVVGVVPPQKVPPNKQWEQDGL